MRRFTLRPERLVDGRVTFDAEESRHLTRVLRLRAGDTVVATDGAGRDYTVRLVSLGDAVTGTVLAAQAGARESPLAITLIQGVPKGDKLETIVRAATELGVTRVRPALCERTVVRLEPSRWRERARRWQRVAREAAKQCGRAVIPEVEPPRPLAEWLAAAEPVDLALCLWEGGGAPLGEVEPGWSVGKIKRMGADAVKLLCSTPAMIMRPSWAPHRGPAKNTKFGMTCRSVCTPSRTRYGSMVRLGSTR